jgi:hypothetical protein
VGEPADNKAWPAGGTADAVVCGVVRGPFGDGREVAGRRDWEATAGAVIFGGFARVRSTATNASCRARASGLSPPELEWRWFCCARTTNLVQASAQAPSVVDEKRSLRNVVERRLGKPGPARPQRT